MPCAEIRFVDCGLKNAWKNWLLYKAWCPYIGWLEDMSDTSSGIEIFTLYQYWQSTISYLSGRILGCSFGPFLLGCGVLCFFSLALGGWNILLRILWCWSSCLQLDSYRFFDLRPSEWLVLLQSWVSCHRRCRTRVLKTYAKKPF